MVDTRAYRDGALVAEGFDLDACERWITDPTCTVWIDAPDPDGAGLEHLAELLGWHPLAIEDAVHRWQRPKLDRYEGHLFIAAYAARLDRESGRLATTEIDAFVSAHALVTVHSAAEFSMAPVLARWDATPDLTGHGVGFLLHGLLDEVIESHYEAVDVLDDEIEALEDILFDERPREREVQRRSFELRKSLVRLRRVALPMREVLMGLQRRESGVVDPELMPYYQDVQDHVLRVAEWTDSLRDLVSTILETHLTVQSNRLNVIMKQVTSWAAIIALPTAVTGWFGQNVPFWGYGSWHGTLMSTALIVATSGGLFVAFRRRDWI